RCRLQQAVDPAGRAVRVRALRNRPERPTARHPARRPPPRRCRPAGGGRRRRRGPGGGAMTTGAVQDIALDRHRTTIARLPDYAAEIAPGVTGRAVLFERALLATPLFFPITIDRHAFRDAFQVDGLYLAEAYDAIFDPAYAAAIAGRRDALATAPPG